MNSVKIERLQPNFGQNRTAFELRRALTDGNALWASHKPLGFGMASSDASGTLFKGFRKVHNLTVAEYQYRKLIR